PRHTSPLIRPWFGQAAGDQGSTAIAFVWEPAPRVPGVRDVSVAPARVAMTVSRPDGTPVFAGASGPSGREGSVVATASPQLTFTAPPGPVVVQMEVLDLSGRVLDRDVRDLAVAAFDSRLGVGTAAVFRSRSEREFRAMSGESANVAPVASRQFSRAEHLIVRLPVHAADDAPVISAVLQSRFGSALRALAVEPVPGAKGFFQVDLRLAPLASGGYAVEFLARSATRSVIERVEFTVTP
ncbi:MAG TPA: hypothetical protein VM032_02790, partial [Vicinamibacterales bacterium]|nr:hypothetical protein [Vicinamibacterales bacterium]